MKARLAEIQKELPEGVEIRSYYDRAEFIGRMLKTVAINLAEGALLVVVVLFLTLGSLRGALIAALAIPLSMGIALIGMVRMGVTGNLMSLGRDRLRPAGRRGDRDAGGGAGASSRCARHGRARTCAYLVAQSMSKAARPVAFALLIILLVYLPLMALEGVEGRMFKPMAITVALALGGALLFSLTAFPALAATLLPVSPGTTTTPNKGFFGAGAPRLRPACSTRASDRPRPVLAVAALALVGPRHRRHVAGRRVRAAARRGRAGARHQAAAVDLDHRGAAAGRQVEEVLARFPEVKSVVTRTGRAEVATDPVGQDETEVMVKLAPKEQWKTAHDLDDLGEAIKQAIEGEVPATFVSVSQPIEDRVNQLLAGSRADVVIKVFGQDLSVLKKTADEIGKVVRDVPGRGDWRVQRVLGLPLLEVKPDRQRLARYGMQRGPVLEVVEASRVGRTAGKIFEGSRRFDLMLLLPPATLTPEAFGELLVGSSTGHLVPLASVATIRETEGPAVINREVAAAPRAGRGERARPRSGQLRERGAPPGRAGGHAARGRDAGVGRPVRELHARQQAARRSWCRWRWPSSSRCCS